MLKLKKNKKLLFFFQYLSLNYVTYQVCLYFNVNMQVLYKYIPLDKKCVTALFCVST